MRRLRYVVEELSKVTVAGSPLRRKWKFGRMSSKHPDFLLHSAYFDDTTQFDLLYKKICRRDTYSNSFTRNYSIYSIFLQYSSAPIYIHNYGVHCRIDTFCHPIYERSNLDKQHHHRQNYNSNSNSNNERPRPQRSPKMEYREFLRLSRSSTAAATRTRQTVPPSERRCPKLPPRRPLRRRNDAALHGRHPLQPIPRRRHPGLQNPRKQTHRLRQPGAIDREYRQCE